NDSLYGEVIGTLDVITFEARSARDLRREFRKSVDEYLKFCAEQGKEPDMSFSGQFLTRADPDLHRKVSILASLSGLSVNAWVVENLRQAVVRAWPEDAAKRTSGQRPRGRRKAKRS